MRYSVLSHSEKAVFDALVKLSDRNGSCMCTLTELAAIACYSVPVVIKSTKALKEMGVLRKKYNGRAKRNEYCIDFEIFQRLTA